MPGSGGFGQNDSSAFDPIFHPRSTALTPCSDLDTGNKSLIQEIADHNVTKLRFDAPSLLIEVPFSDTVCPCISDDELNLLRDLLVVAVADVVVS